MPGKPFIHEVCSVQVATLVFSGYLGRRGASLPVRAFCATEGKSSIVVGLFCLLLNPVQPRTPHIHAASLPEKMPAEQSLYHPLHGFPLFVL